MIIKTRKLAPTNTQGSRIRATATECTASLTIAYPYEAVDPHLTVASMLNKAMEWGDTVIQTVDGRNQYVTVDYAEGGQS